MSKYSYQSNFGKVALEVRENIVIASFDGNINASITSYFRRALEHCLEQVEGHWGYISHSKGAIAATPDAYQQFLDIACFCIERGCACGAYILGNPIAKRQIEKMRVELGFEEPLESVLFDDVDSACQFINAHLEELQQQAI